MKSNRDNGIFNDSGRNVRSLNDSLSSTDRLLKNLQKTLDSTSGSMSSFGDASKTMLPGKSSLASMRDSHQQQIQWMREEAKTRQELVAGALESQQQYSEGSLAGVQDLIESRTQLLQQEQQDRLLMSEEHEETMTSILETYEKGRDGIRQKYFKRELVRQKELLSGTADMFGDLADIARMHGRKGFDTWKRLSMVQAILDGLQAVQSAYAWGMKYGGAAAPLVAAAAAAVATAKTAANVAEIEAQTYASGGYVTGPGSATSDSIPAMLSNGEFVVSASAARGNLELLNAINRGSSGSLGAKLDRISTQLRALNVNLVRKQFTVTNRSRDGATDIMQQDALRRRLTVGGYDGSGENLAL